MSCDFWFGTEKRMGWFPSPLQGADMSPEGWNANGTLLNGGGWSRASFLTHKTFTFEWKSTSALETAAKMKAYQSGTYGRGLIYFIDPMIYDKNVLPERWADPSILLGDEGRSLVYNVSPEEAPVSGGSPMDLPVSASYYDLTGVTSGYRGDKDSVFIPIPEGYVLHLGAFYSATDDGGIFASPVYNGVVGSETKLTPLSTAGPTLLADEFVGASGVRLWLGKDGADGTVTVTAMIGRLYKVGAAVVKTGKWVPGMGHSGCRFSGPPTMIRNTGIRGGTASFAATFREVGDWE